MLLLILAILLIVAGAGLVLFSLRSQRVIDQNIGFGILTLGTMFMFPGFWTMLFAAIAGAGLIILLRGVRKNAIPVSIAGAVMLVGGAVSLSIAHGAFGGSDKQEMQEKNLAYDLAQYEYLGSLSKTKYAGCRIGVILPENPTERQQKLVAAFEQGFGGEIKLIYQKSYDSEEIRLSSSNEEEYLKKLEAARSKTQLAALLPAASNCKVLLLLTALSRNSGETLAFLKRARRPIILPAENAGDTNLLRPFIRNGCVELLVLRNAAFDMRADVPEDVKERFEMRFVLVTPENVATLAAQKEYAASLSEIEEEEEFAGEE